MGESTASLAKEFKVSRAAISNRFSDSVENIKAVAKQIVATNAAVDALPICDRVSAISLADMLADLGQIARDRVETSAGLARMAKIQMNRIDEKNPMEDPEILQGISALGKLSDEASRAGLAIFDSSNKNKPEAGTEKKRITVLRVVDSESA